MLIPVHMVYEASLKLIQLLFKYSNDEKCFIFNRAIILLQTT